MVKALHFVAYGTHRMIEAPDHTRLCLMVVLERAQSLCGACLGRKESYAPGSVVTICAECRGSGKHRYSDGQRQQAFGRKLESVHESALREIFFQYSEAEREGRGEGKQDELAARKSGKIEA